MKKTTPRVPRPRATKVATFPVAVPKNVEKAWSAAVETVNETVTRAAKAAGDTRAMATDLATDLVREPRKFVENVQVTVIRKTNSAKKEATRVADDVTTKLTDAIETVVEKTLHRFNVPTREELIDLTKKVDNLSRKLDAAAKAKRVA